VTGPFSLARNSPANTIRCWGGPLIVEQRDYHVFTGKLPELVGLYESEGIALQQEHLGGLIGAFTVDIGALSSYVHLWGYESLADREERRARMQADERWVAFLARIQPLIHTQHNRILVPTAFSPIR
jgi:NIPSNAP